MKKTANINRAVKRFNSEKEQLGIGIFPTSKEQYDQIKYEYYMIQTTISVFRCPPGLKWCIMPVSQCKMNCPFLILYPFNCERIDGRYMNSRLSFAYDWSWGSLETPTSDLQLNYSLVYPPSPCWIYLQHLQILLDLFEEILHDDSNIEVVADKISLVETSLSNFKSTEHFFSMQLWSSDAEYTTNLIQNQTNINDLKKYIRQSHPLQFVNSMIYLFENDLQNYNNFHCAPDMIQLFHFANDNNESSKCIKVNVMRILSLSFGIPSTLDLVSGLLSVAESCVLDEIHIYFMKFMMIKQTRRVPRAGSRQIQSNIVKINLILGASQGKIMPILCRMHKFHPQSIANVIAAVLNYGEIYLSDFETTESTALLDRYTKLCIVE